MIARHVGGKVRPILVLEMNEIPWRLVDAYLAEGRCPNLRKFLSSSTTHTTLAVDSGELSPWVTWPSLHRGMSNEEHNVRNLGQDPQTFNGTPIWEEYRRAGYSIGVCGSLQSWPPREPGPGGFYVPDTFAHDERCFPASVEPVQRFNLGQVRDNGRVARKRGLPLSGAASLLLSLARLGLTPRTAVSIVRQVATEMFNRNVVARRPIFQTVIFWDIFKGLFNPTRPPAFSTFFTNHVAGVMHRYWHHVFPEDFGLGGKLGAHKETMDFAMGIMDGILADALGFQTRNPDLILAFATSMGQAAVRRDDHHGYEALMPRLGKLMSLCGAEEGQYLPLLAMVPQVAFEIGDQGLRGWIRQALPECRTASGSRLFKVEETGPSLSVTLRTPSRTDRDAGGFLFPDRGGGPPRRVTWEDAGIVMQEVEAGTAYHIPEGILAILDPREAGEDLRTPIPASEVKSFLLRKAGFDGWLAGTPEPASSLPEEMGR
jgi:hypothetical protein